MSVYAAVERDLADIRRRDPVLADSTLAAMALAAAALLDDPDASATSKSMNHHQLRDTMSTLRELCPPEKVRDNVDELRDRRKDRRAKAKDRTHPEVREHNGS